MILSGSRTGIYDPGAGGETTAATGAVFDNGATLTATYVGFGGSTNKVKGASNFTFASNVLTAPQFASTVATGTAPFTVASITNVANLNASSLNGATFAAPGAIGSGTPAAGTFTTLSATTPLPVTSGGSGLATATLGDLRYGSAANTLSVLAGNITTTKMFLNQTGNGSVSAAPAWSALVLGDIPALAATTQVIYGDGTGKATGDSGFTRTSLALTLDANTDNTLTTGYGKMGLLSGAASTQFGIAQASNYNSTDYALQQLSTGATLINAKTGTSVQGRVNNVTKFTLAGTSMTFASGVPVTISDATASSSTITGALIVSGGAGIAGNLNIGGNSLFSGNVTMTANVGAFIVSGTCTAFKTSTANVLWYKSGGTITPNSGDMVFQTGDTAARAFYFVAGTTPAIVASIGATGIITSLDTTEASAVGTASIVTSGGLGIAKRSFLGTIGTTFSGNVVAGVQDGTADTVGAVGEVVQGTNQSTYTNFTTSNTLQQLAVLTNLPRGRWRIVATVTYYGNAATVATVSEAQFAISTTTASIAGAVEGRSIAYVPQQITSSLHNTDSFETDVNISAATSYFLNGKATFSAGNPQYVASLTAYRIR